MEKIADILKVFIEKHLIPTIISVTLAIITYLIVPEDCWVLLKLNTPLFLIFCFCVFYIALSFILWVSRATKSTWTRFENRSYYQKKQLEDNEAAIEKINAFIDKLSPQDKDLIIQFVLNGNKPLLDTAHKGAYGTFLGDERFVHSTLFNGGITQRNLDKHWITSEMLDTLSQGFTPAGDLKLYKLKDAVYRDFSYVYSTTGKLGNFD